MSNAALSVAPLTGTVGAEVLDADADRLAGDEEFARAVLDALGHHGVLVFRELHLEPEAQVEFCQTAGRDRLRRRRRSDPRGDAGDPRPVQERQRARTSRGRSSGTSTGARPPATSAPRWRRSCRRRRWPRPAGRPSSPAPTPPTTTCPTRRRSGSGPAGRPLARGLAAPRVPRSEREGRRGVADAQDLRAPAGVDAPRRSPQPRAGCVHRPRRGHGHRRGPGAARRSARAVDHSERVYRHEWTVGDTVIWDNRGVLHRAAAYDADSPREMFRTTVLGDEPIE